MFKILLIGLAFLVFPLSEATAAKKVDKITPDSQSAQQKPIEEWVVVAGQSVFAIKAHVHAFRAEDRSRAISTRLAKLAKDPLFKIESIKVEDSEYVSDIVAGDTILMSVTDDDAKAEGKTRMALAEEFAGKIRLALDAYRKDFSSHSILFGVLYSVLATIVLTVVIFAINRFYPKLVATIHSWRGTFIRSILIQSFEVLNEERIVAILLSAAKATRLIVMLIIFYFYIPLLLSFFPWTRGLASKLLSYILTPIVNTGHAFVVYLPNLFYLLVIAVITNYVIKFIGFIFSEIEKQNLTIEGFYHDWANPSFKIARFMIIAFAAVVSFPYLPGSDSPAFKGVLVFLGVLFSLGSTSAIANVVAGVILTYMRAFKLGDRVKIADTVGDVIEKTLLVTRIRTIKNVDTTIPNAMVLSSHIINYSSTAADAGLILHTTVTIGYDAPWRQVHELLIAAARATGNILETPAPFVLQTSLDDFYVSYQINAYTDKPSVMARTYSELHQNIQEKFNEGGVEIMSPHYATLRDGNKTTIPEAFLSESYKQPPFRVSNVDGNIG